MHRAKGLEFFAVAIPFLSEATFPPPGALKAAVDAADREDIINQIPLASTRGSNAGKTGLARLMVRFTDKSDPWRLMPGHQCASSCTSGQTLLKKFLSEAGFRLVLTDQNKDRRW